MTDHYDVIVIGSGAGGGTLTYALAPTGKRILLLERGDFLPREPQNWDSKSVWVDLRYHNSGNWTDAEIGEEFPPKQNYYVGGNTKVYGRFCSVSGSAISGRSSMWTVSRRPGR
jgi:choline dehydrogenase-like flavoprotein